MNLNTSHYNIQKMMGTFVTTIFALLAAVTFLFPFIIMIFGSFSKTTVMSESIFYWIPKDINFDNYSMVLGKKNFLRWITNSAIYTVIPTAFTVVTSLILGYIFAKKKFKGREIIFWLFLCMIMVPSQVLAVPRYMLFSRLNWIDTYGIIIIPAIWDISSLFFVRQYMQGIPDEIEEAATIDGCGQFRILFNIIAPMCTSALASVAILRFVYHWNDFFYPLVFLTSEIKYPITVGLASLMAESPSFGLTMAGAVINFLPTFIVFMCLQRYFIEGISTAGLKG